MNETEIKQKIISTLGNDPGLMRDDDKLSFILFLLLWAKFIPQTDENIIGYFDFIESVDTIEKFDFISNELIRLTGIKVQYLLGRRDLIKNSLIHKVDNYRSSLLMVAKSLAKGNKKEIDWIIESFQNIKLKFDLNYKFGPGFVNESVLHFAESIFKYEGSTEKDVINCLFPSGTASAHHFANKNNVSIFEKNEFLDTCTKSLIALYGKPFKFNEKCIDRDFTFALPPIGIKATNIMEWSPFSEDHDSKNIIDLHTKLIYLAHKNTNKITIALTSLNTLFSKTTGINFFRKKIVDNNWIDSIFLLPKSVFSNTNIPSAMLVLKKQREEKPINFINLSDFDKDQKTFPEPDSFDKNKLKVSLKDRVFRVSRNEIISNDYDLNSNKYIVSNEDKKLISILRKRDTRSLGTLVEFLRPLPFKKSLNGSELNEIMISDINFLGEIDSTEKKTIVSEQFLAKSNLPTVKKGDLVISIKGTLGKVGMIFSELENTIPGPSLCILRTYDSSIIQKEYLFQYLRSKLGQRMISRSSQGGYVPFISMTDLKNLQIPIPTAEEQKKAKKISKRSKEIINSIQEMKSELDNCVENGWLDITSGLSRKEADK